MANVTFNLDAIDDAVIGDGTVGFNGGMVSNERANLIEANESANLINTDIDKFGKIRTRRGTTRLGAGVAGVGTYIQGMAYYQNDTDNYLVVANNKRLYKWGDPTWTQIAMGGVQDDDAITFVRLGRINHSAGYAIGETVLTVDNFVTATVEPGQKLYFANNLKSDYFEYTIASSALTGSDTTTITLEEPGLVFPVFDNWIILVKQPGAVNNAVGYPGGTLTITIDGYVGIVKNGEYFTIEHENVLHIVTAHTESAGNTVQVTFTGAIQGEYIAASATAPIIFAQGVDKLFWTAGDAIYAWDGSHTTNLSGQNILDAVVNNDDGLPPTDVHWIAWFQNRLIATALESELDTAYFSDFLDPTMWSREFQSTSIGGGESDPVKAVIPWTDLNLVVFKLHSIYVVNCDPAQNSNPDDISGLVASFAIKLINRNVGCPAPRTAVQIGGGSTVGQAGDIFFLSDSGVRSVRRVIAAEVQTEIGEPLSAPIQDIISRINRTYIDKSVAFFHESHYFLAIPIDGATEPNCVLVYNTILQRWIGRWTGWLPTAFTIEPIAGGVPRMVIGQSNGVVLAWLDDVLLVNETDAVYEDDTYPVPTPIVTQILTRGYTLGDFFCPKTGFNAELEFDESVATVTVVPVLDGQTATSTEPPIDTLTGAQIIVGAPSAILPFVLPISGILMKSIDMQQYGPWRQLQLQITANEKKLQMRSIRITAFYDTLQIQS